MLYSGSKSKIAKHILPIMLSDKSDSQWYVEPFCGGGNMIDKVPGKRIGNDANKNLIGFWRAIQRGWVPPDNLTREEYYDIKARQEEVDDCLVAFAAAPCSFGAKWWGGYAFNKAGKNYAAAAKRNIVKQAPSVSDVVFTCVDYRKMYVPENSVVYCDPPYKGTAGYQSSFDTDSFWDWCRATSDSGHSVFVSEIDAPDDFEVVWEKEVGVRMDKNRVSSRVERLYTLKGRSQHG